MTECEGHPRKTRQEWRHRADGLEESVQFTPGYVCSASGPHSHGRHGMEIRWMLRGPAGAAQFLLFTSWDPDLDIGAGAVVRPKRRLFPPMGADVGYHARRPQFDDHRIMTKVCPVIGGPCYYDGSGLRAETLLRQLLVVGEHAVWAELESVYDRLVTDEIEQDLKG